jgi:zinc protease
MNSKYRRLINLGLVSLFSALSPQLTLAAATTGNVHEYHLDNGLKLIVKEDHRAPIVTSQVWYKVGSGYEHLGITGISHALEHMMFRGTPKYPQGQFSQIISEHGGEQNAFTSYDYTGYYQELAADKLPISFELEADRMQNLSIADADFAKEIQVVMEERRMRTEDNPQRLTFERLLATAFVTNPYHNPVVGWMNDLQTMTAADLRQWYKTWYAPNNAIVVVVGDVKPEAVYELAQKYFGPLKSSKIPVAKPQNPVEPLEERRVVVKAPGKLPWIMLAYNVPVVKTTKTAWEPYALDVLSGILSAGNSGRLDTQLVRAKQIATNAGASYNGFSRLDGLFTVEATPAQGHTTDQLKAALLDQLESVKKNLVTPEELQRIKAQVIAQKIYQKDSISAQAQEIGSLEAVGLSWKEGDAYVKNIEAVTAEQVRAVAQKYLVDNRLTVAEFQPQALSGDRTRSQSPQPTAKPMFKEEGPYGQS